MTARVQASHAPRLADCGHRNGAVGQLLAFARSQAHAR